MAHEQNGDLGNAWLKTNSAGAGPYQLTSWEASDHVILDVNPHSGMPVRCKKVIIRHVADPSAQLLLLQKGDVDIARDLTPDQLKAVAKNEAYHITASGQASIDVHRHERGRAGARRSRQVRQAIKWAIDYDAIAKNITPNIWKVSQSFLPEGLPGALTDTPFHQDIAKAKALLAEAGLPERLRGHDGLQLARRPRATSRRPCRRTSPQGRHQGHADRRREQAGGHQDPRAAAPARDAGVGLRLFRSQLQRPGLLRQPRRSATPRS